MEMKSPLTVNISVRRNPHRKTRTAIAATKCLQKPTVTSSSTPSEVPSFPIDEILAIDVPKINPNLSPNPNPNPEAGLENLRVFLRIRPILHSKDQNPKPRPKNAWPQNPAKKNSAREKTVTKKNSGDLCITVNDSHSVTLFPPLALQESKRIKSEFYEGFSHVFATDSSQEQVFEKMVFPLIEDFLKGKSGMLAALGPSGSGKTHTVFGSPRDPGIVPRTLQRIFEPDLDSASKYRRSFSISIFEIHNERGKGEKIFDLCSDGAELIMRQSIIRGLQEVIVSGAKEAESLIAKAMLMRLTASTNSNSRSSRSQCIINIRGAATDSDGEEPYDAVLSIIDLAGAEREKKTGNQGARLVESSFINNTSMVFGSCLRSLLEHQRNPKIPLQKHFQNSLLTKYLRDYMEGKRRMTLILTVKSEEDNYLDTTHLLRQASPYMSIRCNTVEEQSSTKCNKRQPQAISRKEKPKRMKISGSESYASEIAEKKICQDELCPPIEGVSKEASDVELEKRERSYQILQHFSKALWTVLKQHGKQLKVAEGEVKRLTEDLELEKTRNVELEKKLESLKLSCTCSQPKSTDNALSKEETSKHGVVLIGVDSTNLDKSNVDLSSLIECSGAPPTPKIDESSQIQDQVISSQTNLERHSSNVSESVDNIALEKGSSTVEPSPNLLSQVQVRSLDVNVVHDPTLHVEISQQKSQIDVINSGFSYNLKDVDDSGCFETNDTSVSAAMTDYCDESISQVKPEDLVDEKKQESLNLPKTEKSVAPSGGAVNKVERSASRVKKLKKSLEPSISSEDIVADDPNADRENSNITKVVKPKRRLLPASSLLLRDFNTLDFVDVNEKPRGNRGGKKVTADENYRTQGNTALLRLLQSNHRA